MAAARCDICDFKDGTNGLSLVTCKKCNVSVHRECYGLTDISALKYINACPPCRAVGREFPGRTGKGEEMQVMQTERPAACVLCSVSTGAHAMHPLYDVQGKNGRQLVLPCGSLAWVHTVCASGICQHRVTAGCVYGCDITGNLNDEDSSGDGSDGDGEGPTVDVTTHHYVICNSKDTEWWRVILDSRKLKCTECGKKDNSLRIPIQCTAGDPGEYAPFHEKHQGLAISCTQAMHVGCAKWGRERGPHRRIYFYPGSDTGDPVSEYYCRQHAQSIGAKNDAGTSILRRSSGSMVGYSKLDDAAGLKKVSESANRPSKTVVPERIGRSSSYEASKSVKRTNHALTSVSQSRTNNETEKRPSTVQGKATTRRADDQSTKLLPQRAVRAKSAPASLLHTAPPKEHSPINTKSTKELFAINNALEINALSTSVPWKSPTITKSTKELFAIDNALEIDALSASVPRKKLKTTSRSLGSYVAAAQTVVPVPGNTNAVKQKRASAMATKNLPPAPPYQRNSSIAKTVKAPVIERKKRKISVDVTADAALDADADSPLALTKSKSVRRRYISESKMDDDYFPDDFDWLGTMTADVESALSLAKEFCNDQHEILEARRSYWRHKSGIYGSDFAQLWDKVSKHVAIDDIPQDDHDMRESDCAVGIEYEVDEDVDRSDDSGNNKWANLWTESAPLFQFGDWDTTTHVMKQET